MFRSARLKLTLFYLVILLAFSLTLTYGVRLLSEHEYQNANSIQRGEIAHLLIRLPLDWSKSDAGDFTNYPAAMFNDVQSTQSERVHRYLNRDQVVVSLAAVLVGGALSYWFAGRTLKPLAAAHATQARFASDASHELRTPLASMKVENEVFLRQRTFTEQEARTQIESNLEEVQRLENLSTNLLALTQYEKTALVFSVIDVVTLVDDALKTEKTAAKPKKVTFVKEIAAGKIRGNAESLTQLLTILIDNAIKYGPQKGTVTIKGYRQSGQYVLQVIDQGPGIADKDLPFIFDRLYRGDQSRNAKTSGYGLGLALARQIAQANHGTLRVREHKQGSCFEFRIENSD